MTLYSVPIGLLNLSQAKAEVYGLRRSSSIKKGEGAINYMKIIKLNEMLMHVLLLEFRRRSEIYWRNLLNVYGVTTRSRVIAD